MIGTDWYHTYVVEWLLVHCLFKKQNRQPKQYANLCQQINTNAKNEILKNTTKIKPQFRLVVFIP